MIKKFLPLLTILALAACETTGVVKEDESETVALRSVGFSALPGWGDDSLEGFGQAFARSCSRFAKKDPASRMGDLPISVPYSKWQSACSVFVSAPASAHAALVEQYFQPYEVSAAGGDAEGLFTGYYEASLKGSRVKTPRYNVPLHKRPDDLVMVQLGDFRDDLKGRRIAGRVVGGNLKPYEPRADIVAGNWPHNDEVLVWVDDAVDAFFVQIQGSGLVELPSGETMRIGYAGQNGHVYYAIGRELIKRGALTKENVSMQSIRAWLGANPAQADEIMNSNESYVFFAETKGEGPIGGEGVALTATRSLAVDNSLFPYGVPLWTNIEGMPPRLMVAQDTGGAIRGAVRGDVFWGYGDKAESRAGAMNAKGRYWVLLPK